MPGEPARRERIDHLHEAWVKRRLASGQRDVRDAVGRTGLLDNFLDDREIEILRRFLRISRAMAAIELTSIRKMET